MKTILRKNQISCKIRLVILPTFMLIVFSIAVIKIGVAQETDSINSRSEYVEQHQQDLSLKLALTDKIESFIVHDNNWEYMLEPNTDLKMKLFFHYRFISFSVAFAPHYLPGNNDNAEKGKSEIFDLATTIYLEKWVQRLSYSKISGFYAENPYYVPNQTDRYISFPELHYKNFSGYTAYKFNTNYSLMALENQLERQIKSAGSLMPILVYRYYTLDNKIELTEKNSSQKSYNFEVNLSLGYFHTFVINQNFYAATGAAAGGGIIYSKFLTRFYNKTYVNKSNFPIFRSEAYAALGFNSKRFFAGVQMSGYLENYNQVKGSNAITHEGLDVQVFAGYRFEAPKFLSRKIDRITTR